MDELYPAAILDHYRNPRNRGRLENPDASAERDNPLCGDVIRIDVQIAGDDRVADVRFSGRGCVLSLASASMLTEAVRGERVADLMGWDEKDVLNLLDVAPGPVRMKCALLALRVLQAALENWPQ